MYPSEFMNAGCSIDRYLARHGVPDSHVKFSMSNDLSIHCSADLQRLRTWDILVTERLSESLAAFHRRHKLRWQPTTASTSYYEVSAPTGVLWEHACFQRHYRRHDPIDFACDNVELECMLFKT